MANVYLVVHIDGPYHASYFVKGVFDNEQDARSCLEQLILPPDGCWYYEPEDWDIYAYKLGGSESAELSEDYSEWYRSTFERANKLWEEYYESHKD